MFKTVSPRLILSSLSKLRNLTKSFRIGVCKNDEDTGIVGFEKNKKSYRSGSQNRLPSWLDSLSNFSEDEMRKWYKEFKEIVDEMVTLNCTKGLVHGNERTRELMEYVLPWSTVCGVQTLIANKFYVDVRKAKGKMLPDEEERDRLSFKLAWALEMLSRPLYMMDDFVDRSMTRQNLPCWHTVPGVGRQVMNDALLLTEGAHYLLHKYFGQKNYFSDMIKFIIQSTLMDHYGENELHIMRMEIKSKQTVPYTEKQIELSKAILNAGAYPNMQVVSAMMFVRNGIKDPALIRTAVEIGMELITHSTLVDDWADCYGGKAVMEKESSDIREGKLTWLLFTAFRLASKEQSKRLMTCYGEKDAASIEEVTQIYKDLNISEIVTEMGEKKGREIELRISQLPPDTLPTPIWLTQLDHYQNMARGIVARA